MSDNAPPADIENQKIHQKIAIAYGSGPIAIKNCIFRNITNAAIHVSHAFDILLEVNILLDSNNAHDGFISITDWIKLKVKACDNAFYNFYFDGHVASLKLLC